LPSFEGGAWAALGAMSGSALATAVLGALATCAIGVEAHAASPSSETVTLETVMADPDWIAARVQAPYWAPDGHAVYYSAKRAGSPLVDLHRIELGSGADRVVEGPALGGADAAPVYDSAGKHAAFIRNGDLFERRLGDLKLRQLTRTPALESAPQYSANGALLSYRSGKDWYVVDTATGLSSPAAVLKTEKDPDAEPPPEDLRDAQLRTFATLRKQRDDKLLQRQRADELRRVDPSRPPTPFYLGEDVKIEDSVLSPDARWLLVVTAPKSADKGRIGKLTRFVTDSGYEEFEDERVRVGHNPPAAQSLLLLDLAAHTMHPLSTLDLPGIHDDPLAAVRAENGLTKAPEEKPRGILIAPEAEDEEDARPSNIVWNRAGDEVALELFSVDNKDRWIATVDFARFALVTQDRLTDAAWVNDRFSDLGWLADGRTFWFESEESGYGHLYAKPLNGAARRLDRGDSGAHGDYESWDPVLSADGRWLYFLSNAGDAAASDVYRVPSAGGAPQRITHLTGVESFLLAHDGERLLLTHSASYLPPQLALARADGVGPVRELTDTRTPAYRALEWIEPQFVQVPSTHFEGSIPAKVYRPPAVPGSATRSAVSHPAVVFVHGAGYLQNVHRRYPYYFREQLFNNLLARRGYVVIDMDYRASAGYGRDWRTAIYRQMGHPELEDLLDGKRWLVQQAGVDPARVGIYGGSYGGFMTLMGLFRAPGEFAAGAALRPVTDWREYDPGYTSAILNDPQVDPLAYARSSPLEFADGLADSLLICHGVIDDNVLFEDSMRLYERLVELHKDDFTISPYPLDRHAFTNADSWLDEYKRIDRLFRRRLEALPRPD
jgi:dipeptidyl aminopeptidase/acylaminoacyl peptidase